MAAEVSRLKPDTPGDPEVALYPDLSFHFNLGVQDLFAMPRPLLRAYIKALPRLLAQRQLDLISASSFPWYGPDRQKSILSSLERAVGLTAQDRPNAMTLADFMGGGGGGGFGVIRARAGETVEQAMARAKRESAVRETTEGGG